MKATVVPAQVTTVEDRIIGRLGFSQVLLLIIPVFAAAGIFSLAPPFMQLTTYKYILMTLVGLTFCILAIRIKEKIIASWLAVILRFNLRPKYYVFNKNTTAFREDYPEKTKHPKIVERTAAPRWSIEPADEDSVGDISAAKILTSLESQAAQLRFETNKKGGLHVRFTEVEE